MMEHTSFAAFILTHGRPDSVSTVRALKKGGYTGPVFLVVDNEDDTVDKYIENFGSENVIIFDKKASALTFDKADNFDDRRAIVFARNAVFQIAKERGFKHFVQLDDDYTQFEYRFTHDYVYGYSGAKNVDSMFDLLLRFFERTNIKSIAMAQGGDFLGGVTGSESVKMRLKRKCMNTFICSTERPFQFVGRINEDVNTYTRTASTGSLFFTFDAFSIVQKQTQSNKGGMTDIYLDNGTYVKSFYTVLFHPSSVRISLMRSTNPRIHHKVKWSHTVPCIIPESYKKELQIAE